MAKQRPPHYTADPALAQFVQALPKTETHLHLEGSVSFEQLHGFDPDRYPEPPPFWQPEFRYDNFDHFQALFVEWIAPYHTRADHYFRTAKHVFARCRDEGCRYVETSFHLPSVSWIDTDGPELLDAILSAAPADLQVRIFGGMSHTDYAQHHDLLESALDWEQLSGIDLHGPEYWPVDDGIPDYWHRARQHGKVTKAHAGEFMPAAFVDWTLDNLNVDRIEHGVRAVESPDVVQKLAERGTVLDVCPISNLKLGVEGVPKMADHPIRRLMEHGVCVTVSTDDTFMFGNSLAEEFYALVHELGFNRAELAEVVRNGLRAALLDDPARRQLEDELNRLMHTSPAPMANR